MRALGVPYSDEELANGVDLAKAQAAEVAGKITAEGGPGDLQDKEVVALIAYLKRIGTDLSAKPPTTAPTTQKSSATITAVTGTQEGAR